MKRIQVYAVGILLALVPAVFGLWGNASFSKDVPVRVPDQARTTAAVAKQDPRALVAADRAGRTPVERHHGATMGAMARTTPQRMTWATTTVATGRWRPRWRPRWLATSRAG